MTRLIETKDLYGEVRLYEIHDGPPWSVADVTDPRYPIELKHTTRHDWQYWLGYLTADIIHEEVFP